MRTEVWQKLPPSAAGKEGRIIDWTVTGLRLAAATFPENKAESEHLARLRARWTTQDTATRASSLLEAMDEKRQYAEAAWEGYSQTTWREGYDLLRQLYGKQVEMVELRAARPTLSYLEARNIVEWIAHFFKVLWAEDLASAAALQLPKIRKKQAANVKELYLSQFLSGLSTNSTIHMIQLSAPSSALHWIQSMVSTRRQFVASQTPAEDFVKKRR